MELWNYGMANQLSSIVWYFACQQAWRPWPVERKEGLFMLGDIFSPGEGKGEGSSVLSAPGPVDPLPTAATPTIREEVEEEEGQIGGGEGGVTTKGMYVEVAAWILIHFHCVWMWLQVAVLMCKIQHFFSELVQYYNKTFCWHVVLIYCVAG